ncbi:hypothetical protein BDK51DRAFT_30232 [Blyttiomyces helicus]|uniref:Uncharacterized protein n=1 Tax=Blyttiomyces helicus TaxID=388810 RepID=A0A4V1ISG2_9FUNG|nr:hypothetical protein BDK51DRAFT_30232 [Blyttiomyces helicus]|eukprot:RKO93447.1 hypothetical protein BDK51DRAFT_30232 [Blyttiomyces helicus]
MAAGLVCVITGRNGSDPHSVNRHIRKESTCSGDATELKGIRFDLSSMEKDGLKFMFIAKDTLNQLRKGGDGQKLLSHDSVESKISHKQFHMSLNLYLPADFVQERDSPTDQGGKGKRAFIVALVSNNHINFAVSRVNDHNIDFGEETSAVDKVKESEYEEKCLGEKEEPMHTEEKRCEDDSTVVLEMVLGTPMGATCASAAARPTTAAGNSDASDGDSTSATASKTGEASIGSRGEFIAIVVMPTGQDHSLCGIFPNFSISMIVVTWNVYNLIYSNMGNALSQDPEAQNFIARSRNSMYLEEMKDPGSISWVATLKEANLKAACPYRAARQQAVRGGRETGAHIKTDNPETGAENVLR